MPDKHEKPRGIAGPSAAQPAPARAKSPPKGKKPKADKIVRTESGKFKKGAPSPNPAGRPKQIFFTSKPFKQAIMRALRQRSDEKQADELQEIANKLIDQALTGQFPMGAITEIGNRLDGAAEREPAAPQQNTLQLVMNSIRVLNLTTEQRDAFLKQLEQQPTPNPNGSGEPQ